MLTRIESHDIGTSMIIRLRPGWEELRMELMGVDPKYAHQPTTLPALHSRQSLVALPDGLSTRLCPLLILASKVAALSSIYSLYLHQSILLFACLLFCELNPMVCGVSSTMPGTSFPAM